jgi:hypothetical protein
MRPQYWAISLAVLAFVLPIQGQKPSSEQPDIGRYQLLPVDVAGPRGTNSKQLFLFDSQTGRVWHFRPENMQETGPGKLPDFTPEAFIPVQIFSPNGQKVLPDSK